MPSMNMWKHPLGFPVRFSLEKIMGLNSTRRLLPIVLKDLAVLASVIIKRPDSVH